MFQHMNEIDKSEVIWDGGEHQVKQSFISIAILIIILVTTVYFVSKVMRYKTEREKSAIKKSFIAYLLTDSLLISWLVYRKNDPNNHL